MFLDGRKPGSVAWDLAAGGSWGSQTRANPVGDGISLQDAGCICLYQIPKKKILPKLHVPCWQIGMLVLIL